MKIYTKKGDRGMTSLYDGTSIEKHDLRIEVLGQLDHLNSAMGLILAFFPAEENQKIDYHTSLTKEIGQIQSTLFELGSILAQNSNTQEKNLPENLPETHDTTWITDQTIALENSIDTMSALLPPLKQFILPGGTKIAAFSHNARSTCRCVERLLSKLHHATSLPLAILAYINRLSDYLFTLSRMANYMENIEDSKWTSVTKKNL